MPVTSKAENSERTDERDCLVCAVRQAVIAIRNYLNGAGWWGWLRRWKLRRDPIRILLLEKVAAHLQTLQSFLANPECRLPGETYETLPGLLAQLQKPEELSFGSAWEVADALEGELLKAGDKEYITGIWRTWPGHRIPERLRGRVFAEDGMLQKKRTIEHEIRPFLLEDHRDHAEECRRERAMIRLRGGYLKIMAAVLLVLDIAFCYSYQSVDSYQSVGEVSWKSLLLILSAGAIGSVLSRATKLSRQPLPSQAGSGKGQELPLGIRSLMSAGAIFWVQPIIGATAALIVYLVFGSTILRIRDFPEPTIESLAVLAFVSGFSEPFLTDVIGRVGGKVE